MNLISSRQRVPRPSYPIRGKFGEQVKGPSPKELKSLIVDPYVAHKKIQGLRCNKNLISSPQQARRPSNPFRGKFGRSGKGSFNEKAKIVQRASLCIASETICSKLQYDPFLISVACSQTELSISDKLWEIRSRVVHRKKAKIVDGRSVCSTPESTGSKLQCEPHLFSVACSQTELSTLGENWKIWKRIVNRKC